MAEEVDHQSYQLLESLHKPSNISTIASKTIQLFLIGSLDNYETIITREI